MSDPHYMIKVLDRKKKGAYKMLTQKMLDTIVYEYQHGGVKSYRHQISMGERKALIKYLISLPTHTNCDCEVK
jgi:hypothetical protein